MENDRPLFSLVIDPVTKAHLNDTARWARFLSIAGLVIIGLAFILAVLTLTLWKDRTFGYTITGRENEEVTNTMRIGYMIFMMCLLLVAFFPLMYLLQFSNRMRVALAANEQQDLNLSFLNLKKYFRYLGIIILIALAFYAVGFVMTIIIATG